MKSEISNLKSKILPESLLCPLRRSARLYPNSPAIVTLGGSLTFRDVDRRVEKVSRSLASHGIGHGDRVALNSPSSPDYVVNILSLLRLGAIVCPISTRLPRSAVESALAAINCQTMLVPPDFTPRHQVANVDHVAFSEANRTDRNSVVHQDLTAEIRIPSNQDASIFFTSGSTGDTKAVLHQFGNHWYSADGANKNIPLLPNDRWLLTLPLYHVGGFAILFRCLLAGASLAIYPQQTISVSLAGDETISHISLVPNQLQKLVETPNTHSRLRRLRSILLGGDMIRRPLVESAESLEFPIFTTYGCTEMASQVTTTSCNDIGSASKTAGRLVPNREMMISDQREIFLRGRTLFKGYVRENHLELPFDSEGWYASGDLGFLDDNGYLIVIGRKDSMFISGGENIHPEEIERALMNYTEITEAIVVPIPDSEFGYRPVAFIKKTNGAHIEVEVLKNRLATGLPKFKIPVRFFDWQETENAASRKTNRRFFQAQARALLDTPGGLESLQPI